MSLTHCILGVFLSFVIGLEAAYFIVSYVAKYLMVHDCVVWMTFG